MAIRKSEIERLRGGGDYWYNVWIKDKNVTLEDEVADQSEEAWPFVPFLRRAFYYFMPVVAISTFMDATGGAVLMLVATLVGAYYHYFYFGPCPW